MTALSKLHATGNDFLVTAAALRAADAIALCNRFTGVGADGLLLLAPGADGADATMTLFNADGSLAEMSGNGARCLAWAARRARHGHHRAPRRRHRWWSPHARPPLRRERAGRPRRL